jgi:hypothetical protein
MMLATLKVRLDQALCVVNKKESGVSGIEKYLTARHYPGPEVRIPASSVDSEEDPVPAWLSC